MNIRIKIIKPHHKYAVGETVYVSPNEAHGLLDSGVGIKSKDMVVTDYKVTKKAKKRG